MFLMSLGGGRVKYLDMLPVIEHWRKPIRVSTPVGTVILLDGVSRLQWAHAVLEDDATERWTIMIRFRKISDHMVGFSERLQMPIFESRLFVEFPDDEAEDERMIQDSDWNEWAGVAEVSKTLT